MGTTEDPGFFMCGHLGRSLCVAGMGDGGRCHRTLQKLLPVLPNALSPGLASLVVGTDVREESTPLEGAASSQTRGPEGSEIFPVPSGEGTSQQEGKE